MNIITKMKDKVANKLLDIGDWFQTKGDDFFEVDKQCNELKGLLPEKVCELLDVLEGKKDLADSRYENESNAYRQSSDNREYYFELLQEKKSAFKSFKDEHHGVFGKAMYNLTPLRFFSSVGREYQRLRKEIKILKREHAHWVRCADENQHVFQDATEQRKEARKALAEYKRIIVGKANIYKEEFKLIKEYDKLLMMNGENKIEELYGKETKDQIEGYLNLVMDKWYDMEDMKPPFDIKKVTKVINKIRKGQKINKNEEVVMHSKDPHENTEKEENKEKEEGKENTEKEENREEKKNEENKENKENKEETIQHENKPKTPFSINGVDRNVVEKIIAKFGKEPIKNFSAEQYMAFLAIAESDEPEKVKEAYVKIVNEKDEDVIQKQACQGTKMISDYMKMSDKEKKKCGNRVLETIAYLYGKTKEDLENEKAQQSQQIHSQSGHNL